MIIHNILEKDPVSIAIAKYSVHPNEVYNHENRVSFSFQHTTYETVYLQIRSLDCLKVKILKENCDNFAKKILIDFHSSVDLGTFLNNFKLADVTQSFKTGGK